MYGLDKFEDLIFKKNTSDAGEEFASFEAYCDAVESILGSEMSDAELGRAFDCWSDKSHTPEEFVASRR